MFGKGGKKAAGEAAEDVYKTSYAQLSKKELKSTENFTDSECAAAEASRNLTVAGHDASAQ